MNARVIQADQAAQIKPTAAALARRKSSSGGQMPLLSPFYNQYAA